MKIQTKFTRTSNYFNLTIRSECYVEFKPITLLLLLFFCFASCNEPNNSAQKRGANRDSLAANKVLTNQSEYQDYLNRSNTTIAQLNETQIVERKKTITELQNDSAYISLVDKQVVNEKYLVALQAIGEGIVSLKTSDGTFSIPLTTEYKLKKIPGALRFVICTISLEALGGVSKEILEVYSRYLLTYRISGNSGTVNYHTDTTFTGTISKAYTLAPALVIFRPNNHVYLDEYYEDVKKRVNLLAQ